MNDVPEIGSPSPSEAEIHAAEGARLVRAVEDAQHALDEKNGSPIHGTGKPE